MKKYVEAVLLNGERIDGRKFGDFRKPVEVSYNVSNKAEGSARVKIGKTEVIAGVKMDVGTPYADSADRGNLMIGAERLPVSNPEFLPGPPNAETIELARIVDRGIRESGMIDLKKLCIRKGELVWNIIVDIYTINDDGNLIDASALAAVAALKSAVLPELVDDKVQWGKFTKTKVPLNFEAINVTVYKIGKELVIDANLDEEAAADARLSVSVSETGSVHAMQKGGAIGMTIDEIDKAIGMAIKAVKPLRGVLK
jgi:exosome complex component RRP42